MKNEASERYLRYEKLKTLGLPVPDHVWTRVDDEWNALERLVSGRAAPRRASPVLVTRTGH